MLSIPEMSVIYLAILRENNNLNDNRTSYLCGFEELSFLGMICFTKTERKVISRSEEIKQTCRRNIFLKYYEYDKLKFPNVI